jgi:hypothetical protein
MNAMNAMKENTLFVWANVAFWLGKLNRKQIGFVLGFVVVVLLACIVSLLLLLGSLQNGGSTSSAIAPATNIVQASPVAANVDSSVVSTPTTNTAITTTVATVVQSGSPTTAAGCSADIPFCYMGFSNEGGKQGEDNLYEWMTLELMVHCDSTMDRSQMGDWWKANFGLADCCGSIQGGTPEGAAAYSKYVKKWNKPQDLRFVLNYPPCKK